MSNFRDPVFVRNDDTCNVRASVVEWCDTMGRPDGVSVRLRNGNGESVLVNAEDWQTLVSCINAELNRVG